MLEKGFLTYLEQIRIAESGPGNPRRQLYQLSPQQRRGQRVARSAVPTGDRGQRQMPGMQDAGMRFRRRRARPRTFQRNIILRGEVGAVHHPVHYPEALW